MSLKLKRIDARQVREIQKYQYRDRIFITDTVSASSQKITTKRVASSGAFYCEFITGSFTTKDTAGGVTDSGINYLTALISDGGNNLPLSDGYVPLDLLLTPGRIKSLAAGAASNPLYYPMAFEHLFDGGNDIIVDVKNGSDVANTWNIVFHGWRIRGA